MMLELCSRQRLSDCLNAPLVAECGPALSEAPVTFGPDSSRSGFLQSER